MANGTRGRPLLVGSEGSASRLEPVPLAEKGKGQFDEAWLQRLVHRQPGCLPVGEIEPGFGEPVAICMELATPHGPVDNLLMSPEGDVIMVETKLWRNPEARRKVIAQALDYASCLFEMSYEDLQRKALAADLDGRPRPASLLDLFPESQRPDEVSFIDAVNRNLGRGEIMVLVAGDGIRPEMARLAEMLQAYAGFRFTFALVELAVYRVPETGAFLVVPSTLARTELVERAIVRVEDHRVSVLSPATTARPKLAAPSTISKERFLEAMAERRADLPERLEQFLSRLAAIGVKAEFRRSLILRWASPGGGTEVNLGYIQRDGGVWTEAASRSAPKDLARAYIEELARAFGGEVDRESMSSGDWYVKLQSRIPRIEEVADRLDGWYQAAERFVSRLREQTG
jgi:hypothetical protein